MLLPDAMHSGCNIAILLANCVIDGHLVHRLSGTKKLGKVLVFFAYFLWETISEI